MYIYNAEHTLVELVTSGRKAPERGVYAVSYTHLTLPTTPYV